MKALTFFSLVALVSIGLQPAHAEVDKGLAQCAAIDNAVTRLACFDVLAKDRGAAPSTESTTSSASGKWRTYTDIDPMTDKEVYTAILEADSGRSRLGRNISMVVRCADNKTDMYINWNDFLGSGSVSTTYRIDKEPAKTSGWNLSTDKTAAFLPRPIATLKKLADSSSFVANVTPYNENPVTAVFNTAGADAAFTDIRKGCGW